MAIRLEITFTGLFLFVPDSANGTLNVVLPSTGFGPVHLHKPTINEQGGQRIVFGDEDLSLIGSGPGANVLTPPTETVQLRSITNRPLEFDQIRKPGKRPNIHARIVLPRATSMGPGAMPALFNVPVLGPQRLSHRVEWTLLNLDQASAVFERRRHDGSTVPPFNFQPDAEDVVRLCIQHLPDHDDEPTNGYEAKHFQAYYRVYLPPAAGANPRLAEDPRDEPPHPCMPQQAASTFTCMTAQVVPG